MALKEALGFSLKPVRVDQDGKSAPPETSALAPPSESPASKKAGVVITEKDESKAGAARLFQATNLDPLAHSEQPAINIIEASAGPDNDSSMNSDEDDEDEDEDNNQHPDSDGPKRLSSIPSEDLRQAGLPAGRSVYRFLRGALTWVRAHRALLIAGLASTTVAIALIIFVLPSGNDDLIAENATDLDSEVVSPKNEDNADEDVDDQAENVAEQANTQGASSGKTAEPESSKVDSASSPSSDTAAARTNTANAKTSANKPTKVIAEPAEVEGPDPWETEPIAPAGPCIRQGKPKRISSQVARGFPLESLAVPHDVTVLVGSSERSGEALGLQINATNLESSVIFRQPGKRALLGVVPKIVDKKPVFVVDRVSIGGHREWRTLPGLLELALTRTNRGVHLIRSNDHKTISLWSIPAGMSLSRAQVVRFRKRRFGIVFRLGGSTGDIVIGWLDARTLRRSSLADLPFEGHEVGLPSISIRDGRAVVAAATRVNQNSRWTIELTTARWRRPSRHIDIPGLNPRTGADRFAPKIVAVSRDRWLLQWTEGTEGKRRVRGLTLDSSFAPLGDVFSLSPENETAGGGLLAPIDEGLLSLYLVQKGSRFELWGSTVACD